MTSLESFIEDISGDEYLRVQDDLGDGFVRLRAAEAQRRQAQQDIRSFEDVVLELLRNSRDAHARAIFVATWIEGNERHLTILDDGDGIPSHMHETVFEPFVTSKLDSFHADRWGVHGRGMALYSIRENVQTAKILASQPGLGSVFSISSSLDTLPEKKDQSTLPSISKDSEGHPVLRGPHNITRIVMEFAIEERSRISVYLGSSTSIAATLYHLGSSAASCLHSVFSSYDEQTTPYIQRFAYIDDAQELTDLCESLGLPLSARSAYRILEHKIEPLPLHLESLRVAQSTSDQKGLLQKNEKRKASKNESHHLGINAPKIKISKDDLQSFEKDIALSFDSLARSYYLNSEVSPKAHVVNNELVIRIPLQPDDHSDIQL